MDVTFVGRKWTSEKAIAILLSRGGNREEGLMVAGHQMPCNSRGRASVIGPTLFWGWWWWFPDRVSL